MSILEELYYSVKKNCTEIEEIKDTNIKLDNALQDLGIDRSSNMKLDIAIVKNCSAFEKQGFVAGFKTAIDLIITH